MFNLFIIINYFALPGLILCQFSHLRSLDIILKIVLAVALSMIIVNISTYISSLYFMNSFLMIVFFEILIVFVMLLFLRRSQYIVLENNIDFSPTNLSLISLILLFVISYVSYFHSTTFFHANHDELFQIYFPAKKVWLDGRLILESMTNVDAVSLNILNDMGYAELDGHLGPLFNFIGAAYFFIGTGGDDSIFRLQHFVFYFMSALVTLLYARLNFPKLQTYTLLAFLTFPSLIFLSTIYQYEIAVYFFGVLSLVMLKLSKLNQSIILAFIAGLIGASAMLSKEMALVYMLVVLTYLIFEEKNRSKNLVYLIAFSTCFIHILSIGAANQISSAQKLAYGDEVTLANSFTILMEFIQFYFNNNVIYDLQGWGFLVAIFAPLGMYRMLQSYGIKRIFKFTTNNNYIEIILLVFFTLGTSFLYHNLHPYSSEVTWFGGHSVTMHMPLIILTAMGMEMARLFVKNCGRGSNFLLTSVFSIAMLFSLPNMIWGSGHNMNAIYYLYDNKYSSIKTGKESVKYYNPNHYDYQQTLMELDKRVLIAMFAVEAYLVDYTQATTLTNIDNKQLFEGNSIQDFKNFVKSKNIGYISKSWYSTRAWSKFAEKYEVIRAIENNIHNENHFIKVYDKNDYKIFKIIF